MDMTKVKKTDVKKPYKAPRLKDYGDVKLTTRGSGSANGDGGMSMMV